jgi:hypothetical protein
MQSLSSKRPTPARRSLVSLAPLALSLAACGADQVSLGTGDPPLENEAPELCPDGIAHGNFELRSQEQVDALSGCEVIAGELSIIDTPELDLKPLRSIRVVRDTLLVGGDEEAPAGPMVASLEGLESVERVGGLVIGHLVSDLAPLANLTQVRRDPLSGSFGSAGIEINFSDIQDLTGLENLVDWSTLFMVGNDDLESLRGLTLRLADQEIFIQHSPRLRDLAGLGGATHMQSLWLWNTAIENFDGVQLESLGSLDLKNSPRLTSLNGLSQRLRSIEAIILHDNDQLQELPTLPSAMNVLSIAGNDNLRSIQPFRQALSPAPGRSLGTPFAEYESRTINADEVPFEVSYMEVGNNPLLGEVHLPANFSSGSYVGIYDNPSLTRLGLGTVENVDRLAIRNNASLEHIDMPALKRADDLDVRDNPNLSTAIFDAVQTFSRDMAGNLEAPAP